MPAKAGIHVQLYGSRSQRDPFGTFAGMTFTLKVYHYRAFLDIRLVVAYFLSCFL